MTYEQGGSGRAGLAVLNSNGDTLSLKDRIAHHLTTGLSTVEVAAANHSRLNDEFRKFFGENKPYENKTYVLNGNEDQLASLAKLLEAHRIDFGQGRSGTIRGFDYQSGSNGSQTLNSNSLVIPGNQKKSTLVKVLFEPNARLDDSLTYDITAWSLPYAYGLQGMITESRVPFDPYSPAVASGNVPAGSYGYLGDWDSMKDARFLAALLGEGIRVRRALSPFELEGTKWDRGTLIITRSDNSRNSDFEEILGRLSLRHNKPLKAISTGLVSEGKDFGSRYVEMIPETKVAILSGEPASTLRFGEVWHFFERQLQYPVSVLDTEYFDRVSLEEYDVLILPDGRGYRGFLNEDRKEALVEWVREGGRLIAMGSSLSALGGEGGFGIAAAEGGGSGNDNPLMPLDELRRSYISNAITGAIFKSRVDSTHPLAFGYGSDYFTLKVSSGAYSYLEGGSNVVTLGENPEPVSGFAGSKALEQLPESLIFGVEYSGRGSVVYFADNPLFRGFWEGGKLFFANALFMVD